MNRREAEELLKKPILCPKCGHDTVYYPTEPRACFSRSFRCPQCGAIKECATRLANLPGWGCVEVLR